MLAQALGERERKAKLGGCRRGGPTSPFGACFWRAVCALRNVGELGLIWLSDCERPLLLGSGQLVTPCARMQLANLTAPASGVCAAELWPRRRRADARDALRGRPAAAGQRYCDDN